MNTKKKCYLQNKYEVINDFSLNMGMKISTNVSNF